MLTAYLLRITGAAMLVAAGAFFVSAANAGSYPDRPIRMIVPYAAGGSTDNVARIVGARLSETLGQSVVIENRGGAGGKIGIDMVAKAAPDGYTLLFTESGSMIVNAWLFDRSSSHPVKDFDTIGQITVMQNVLVSHPSAGMSSLRDVIDNSKTQPLSYGSSGTGTLGHLGMEMLNKALKIDALHIPYKGGAPVTNDLLGGQIPMAVLTVPTAAPHIESGKLIPVAALSETRTPILPDVPTVQEQGYAPISATLWQGLYAPAGTPSDILELLNQELNKISTDLHTRELLISAGNEVTGDLSLEQSANLVRDEYEKWGREIEEIGLTPQ